MHNPEQQQRNNQFLETLDKEFTQHQREEWLRNPLSIKLFILVQKRYEELINYALGKSGSDDTKDLAIKALIKANILKELLTYGNRNE